MALDKSVSKKLSGLFDGMMEAVYKTQGGSFSIDLLAAPQVREFIGEHASVLDSSFARVEMPEAMRRRLHRSDYIFSGLKTFHELNEAFPSLIDSDGNRKPFETFLNDVRKIDNTYNRNYLRAEYNFAVASAEMAAKWERFAEDGDEYNLQYRTVGDSHVRPEHAALHGVTLPMSDPFWQEYYPPNGWNCRCSVTQVRKSKYPATDHNEAMERGAQALQRDKKGMFHFNPGIEGKTFPDYNPYTISRCRDCDIAKGIGKFARQFIPDNELCSACKIVNRCYGDKEKSLRAIERTHYLHEMEPLLTTRSTKEIPDAAPINVGFCTYGNKHLYADTFGRSSVLTKDDLKDLGKILDRSVYEGESGLTHPRNDDINKFFYFKTSLHGRDIRLNVAQKVETDPKGRVRVKHFLYSVNDIDNKSTKGGS